MAKMFKRPMSKTTLLIDFQQNTRKQKKDGNPSSVPETGLEPARPCEHWSLKPARLPIPPLGHFAVAKVQLFFFMAKIFFEKKGFWNLGLTG